MANLIDITGQKFGRLTALRVDDDNQNKHCGTKWICECDCGTIKSIRGYDLRKGKVLSCGCLRNEKVREAIGNHLEGQRFGKLTVKYQVDSIKESSGMLRTAWLCQCDCGNEVIVKTINLKSGDTQSCGCHVLSHSEVEIERILKQNNISFSQQFTFADLKSSKNKVLRFDFAIFNNEHKLAYLLEYNGQQHYTPVEHFGGEEYFKALRENDLKKQQYCELHNIPLFVIKYTDEIRKDNVIRKEFLNENN